MIKTKISILFFIWSALIFLLNLNYNFSDELDTILFWLTAFCMIGTIMYQIFFIKNKTFIIFEIFIVYFLFHLIYQLGYYGLRGSDSYVDFTFYKSILNRGNFVLGESVTGWPIIHLLASAISTITKINPLLVAKFLPSFITSIIVLPIYLLITNIYKNKKVALLSCLIFSTIPQFISFEAVFVRESIAIFIFILFFFIIYIAKMRKDTSLVLLSIILVPVLVFGHHFTSFMFIIFMTIFIGSSAIIPVLYRKNHNLKFNVIQVKTILLITLAAILVYWLYLAVFIIEDFFIIFYEATGVKELVTYAERVDIGGTIKTLRGNIIYYGFFFFQGILSLILLIKFLTKKNNEKIEDVSFTMFLYFSLFYGFIALFILGSMLFPDRFLPFGWMFGLIPLTAYVINTNNNIIRKSLVILLISFMVFNLYNVDPEFYTGNVQIKGSVATEKEYLIAENINFSEPYYGYIGLFGAVYDIQGLDFRIGIGRNPLFLRNLHNSSDIVAINELIYLNNLQNIKNKMSRQYELNSNLLSYKNDRYIDKICDIGNIYVLKGGD
jgi:hypothetical protein